MLPPKRLLAVSVMCGMGPLDIDTSFKGILTRVALAIAWPIIPTVVRLIFQNDPIGRIDLTDEVRLDMLRKQIAAAPPKNAAEKVERESVKEDPNSPLRALRSCREAFSQGFYHTGFDGRLMAGRYGFRIEDIRKDLPIQLWYGTLDGVVPINHGRQIAARLGHRVRYRESEDTHGSLQVRYQREAWQELLKDP
jgi:hypothetical protein